MFAALTRSLVCLALVFVALSAAQAQAPKPGREALLAARYALTGRNVDDIKVFGHGFNIYAAKITESQGVTTISGRIAHRLRLRKDDQVHYVIKKKGNQVLDVDIKLYRGGMIGYTLMAMDVLTLKQLDLDGPDPYFARNGSWESAAELIVAAIAVKARAQGSDPNDNRPNPYQPKPASGAPAKPASALPTAAVRDVRKDKLNLVLGNK